METNPLLDRSYHEVERKPILFTDLKPSDKIVATRLRLTSDSGMPTYDISYLHATVNGEHRTIFLPTDHIARKTWRIELINMCKNQKVFIKDLLAKHVVSLNV